MANSNRLLITGALERGKTTLCEQLAKLAGEAGWEVRGVLSLAVFVAGRKVSIDLVNLSSGERRPLAHRDRSTDGICTKRWNFIQNATEWGNAILGRATSYSDSAPCDLLIIDELGPLELVRGEGWLNGLTAIESGNYRLAVVVIRPALLHLALEKWPDAEVIEISAPEQANQLAARIADRFS